MSRILAIFLAATLLPSAGGSAEPSGVVHHGGESEIHQHEQEKPASEHGCSVLFHVCSCHASVSSTPAAERVEVGAVDSEDRRSRLDEHDAASTRVADPPPLPPPIA